MNSKKSAESISAIDFILNFIQSRSDFGGSLSDAYRKDISKGLAIYGDLLQIKVNGVPLNIIQELYVQDPKTRTMVSPEDRIEISGPMMVDGEKQPNHADPSRRETMNGRTRFFFEFFLSDVYIPTELLVP